MKNNPLFSLVTESFDRMFVIDKRGKTIFFPWGDKKQGYYIKNKRVVAKAKNFYKASLLVCFIALIISTSFFDNSFWGIIGSMFVCFGSWYLANFLYASRIVKSLQPANASYKEVILEKLELEVEIESAQPEIQISAQMNKPISSAPIDLFAGIKRIWYRLSPSQLFMANFFIGMFSIAVWIKYHPQKIGESPEDFLVLFIACFFWGLAFYVYGKNLESEKRDWLGFIHWKLPAILTAAFCWIMAAICLYKFVVMIIA